MFCFSPYCDFLYLGVLNKYVVFSVLLRGVRFLDMKSRTLERLS